MSLVCLCCITSHSLTSVSSSGKKSVELIPVMRWKLCKGGAGIAFHQLKLFSWAIVYWYLYQHWQCNCSLWHLSTSMFHGNMRKIRWSSSKEEIWYLFSTSTGAIAFLTTVLGVPSLGSTRYACLFIAHPSPVGLVGASTTFNSTCRVCCSCSYQYKE